MPITMAYAVGCGLPLTKEGPDGAAGGVATGVAGDGVDSIAVPAVAAAIAGSGVATGAVLLAKLASRGLSLSFETNLR
jgi:hypothetical protein